MNQDFGAKDQAKFDPQSQFHLDPTETTRQTRKGPTPDNSIANHTLETSDTSLNWSKLLQGTAENIFRFILGYLLSTAVNCVLFFVIFLIFSFWENLLLCSMIMCLFQIPIGILSVKSLKSIDLYGSAIISGIYLGIAQTLLLFGLIILILNACSNMRI